MAVGNEEIFIIFLIVILLISAALTVYPVFSNVARNKCIMQQWNLMNSFPKIMNLVKEKGGIKQDYSFLVMGCTECIWYDSVNSQWVIQITNEKETTNKPISYRVLGVADGCLTCDDPKEGDKKCANLVKDHTYNFEVGEDYVKCTDCPDSPNLVD